MTMTGRFGSKSGVTLVELLVVMLIVVILAVSMMPFLRDYIVRARYVAEAVPVVGDMITKIQLHRYEPGRLPGTKDYGVDPAIQYTSRITGASVNSYIQTWEDITVEADAAPRFGQGVGVYAAGAMTQEGLADDEATHIGRDLNIEAQHLTGRRLRPDHVFYMSKHQSSDAGTGYAYAVGVFGNGKGLNAGSGYAVMEVYNSTPGIDMKLVAEWRRFTERGAVSAQVPMVSAHEDPRAWSAAGGRAAYEAGICHAGDFDALMSDAADAVAAQLEFLEAAGWEFTKK